MTYEGEHMAGIDLLARLDKEYVWHPFTQMQDWMKSEPLIIQRGEGPYLIDIEGKRYIDGVSSLWVIVHGHGKQEIIEAIERQAARAVSLDTARSGERAAPCSLPGS